MKQKDRKTHTFRPHFSAAAAAAATLASGPWLVLFVGNRKKKPDEQTNTVQITVRNFEH